MKYQEGGKPKSLKDTENKLPLTVSYDINLFKKNYKPEPNPVRKLSTGEVESVSSPLEMALFPSQGVLKTAVKQAVPKAGKLVTNTIDLIDPTSLGLKDVYDKQLLKKANELQQYELVEFINKNFDKELWDLPSFQHYTNLIKDVQSKDIQLKDIPEYLNTSGLLPNKTKFNPNTLTGIVKTKYEDVKKKVVDKVGKEKDKLIEQATKYRNQLVEQLTTRYPKINEKELEAKIQDALKQKGFNDIVITASKPRKNMITINTETPQELGNIDLKYQYRSKIPFLPKTETSTYKPEYENYEGLRKTADFPNVQNYKGAAATIHNTINEYLKANKLGTLLSGGTGHSSEGLNRWNKLVQRGIAEKIGEPSKELYRLKMKGGLFKYMKKGGVLKYQNAGIFDIAYINPKNWGVSNYSNNKTFNEAFSKAQKAGEKEFIWNSKRYNTKLVPKEDSDLYHKSKEFLQDYYINEQTFPTSSVMIPGDSINNFEALRKYNESRGIKSKKELLTDNDYVDEDPYFVVESVEGAFPKNTVKKALKRLNSINTFKDSANTAITNKRVSDKKQKLIENLNTPYYFSITNQKGRLNEDGFHSKQDKKIFINTKDKSQNYTTPVHELSHKASRDGDYELELYIPKLNVDLINSNRHLYDFSQEGFEYLSSPSEIQARKEGTIFYLRDKNKVKKGELITENHLKDLYNSKDTPFDIKQLLDLYKGQKNDLLNYLNNNWDNKQSYVKEENLKYKKGGIYIKPENRGKFTEYCGGKVTTECIEKGKNSPNPTTRKRANFAANSRTWNKKEGGMFKFIK